MNTQLNNAFFRIMILAKIIETDSAYFLPQCKHSGIKNTLKRLKDGISNGVLSIKLSFSQQSRTEIERAISPDKIASIQNILSRLVLMDDGQLSELEDDILKVTQVEKVEG